MNQHPLTQSVEKTLLDFSMLQSGDKVLVAVSGGPDSIALLHVLLALKEKYDIRLGVAHLDHGLRASSAAGDAAFVTSVCHHMGIPSHVEKTDIRYLHHQQGGSIEALGRKERYRFFSRIARKFGYNKTALGHHADDNAELVLMNLFRGSGLLGLSGIPPVRNHGYIRPLIEQPRERIMRFLQDNRIDFVLDATNNDRQYLRNRIRHELIPELIHRYNPRLVDTLNRTAAIFRDEEDWLNRYSGRLFDDLAHKDATRVEISVSKLLKNHGAIQRRIVRTAIQHVKDNLKSITLQHIDAVLKLCREGYPGQGLSLPRLIIRKQGEDRLSISRRPPPITSRMHSDSVETAPIYRTWVPHPDAGNPTVVVKEIGATLVLDAMPVDAMGSLTSAGQSSALFDMDKLTFPLLLRNTLPGDRFRPLGMQGTQKVKRFFINNKIPREIRRKTPVLISRDAIVWVVGHRIDEGAKITQQTRNVLRIELFLA